MSGFHTHMLIGGVGGLTAFKMMEALAPTAVTVQFGSYTLPSSVVEIGCIVVSAYLALWPDIDEPGSHISHRALQLMWLFGATVAFIFLLAASVPMTWLLI